MTGNPADPGWGALLMYDPSIADRYRQAAGLCRQGCPEGRQTAISPGGRDDQVRLIVKN